VGRFLEHGVDLGEAAGVCTPQLDSWHHPAAVTFVWLKCGKLGPFQRDDQLTIDEAVRQWRLRLHACIRARGEYFKQTLNYKYDWLLHSDSHYVCCNVANMDTSCFWVTSLKLLQLFFADVDKFYWNLVICLQLDITLLVQNFVKIRRCLPQYEIV